MTREQAERECVEALKAKRRIRLAAKAAEAEKQAVATIPVSRRMAEAIEAQPDKVAIVAEGPNGTRMFETPKPVALGAGHVRVRADLVAEVDGQGRPVWDRPGIVSDYDPYSRERMWGDRE
jgi:hypothetical protein